MGDDNPDWRPNGYGYRRWGTEVGIRFPVIKLLDYVARRAELEQSANPFATVILAHLDTLQTRQDLYERKDRKFRLVRGLYERGWDAGQARQLFRLIEWMMELPEPLEREMWQQVDEFKKEKEMPYITTPERIGLEQGLIRGIDVALRLKFKDAGRQLLPEIRLIQDKDKLETILDSIESAATLDELRKIWAP